MERRRAARLLGLAFIVRPNLLASNFRCGAANTLLFLNTTKWRERAFDNNARAIR
jgi:hypothetical protein